MNLDNFSKGELLIIKVTHIDGSSDLLSCSHTYNDTQINWFKAGSALNLIKLDQ